MMEYGFWTPYKAEPLSKFMKLWQEKSRQLWLELRDEMDKLLLTDFPLDDPEFHWFEDEWSSSLPGKK